MLFHRADVLHFNRLNCWTGPHFLRVFLHIQCLCTLCASEPYFYESCSEVWKWGSCRRPAFSVDYQVILTQIHQTQHRVWILHVYGLQQLCRRTWLWIYLIPNPALLSSFPISVFLSVETPLKMLGACREGCLPLCLPAQTYPRWDQNCSKVTKKWGLSVRKHVLIAGGSCFENHYLCGLMPAYMYTACGLSFEVSEALHFGTNTAPSLTFSPA